MARTAIFLSDFRMTKGTIGTALKTTEVSYLTRCLVESPKFRILYCLPGPVVKVGKRICLILTDMLEKIVHPESPTSKEKEHIAEYVIIEGIDVEMIRQQKMGHKIEETLEQQLQ
ncbi:21355_t:CDS:1, partial [Gigaspora rosea]